MSPNVQGSNQFYEPEPKYGDVKRMEELKGAAPMSGAPLATPVVNAPQTAQARATNGAVSPAAAPKPSKGTLPPPDYAQELAATWAEIARTPGASELVQAIAARAMRQLG